MINTLPVRINPFRLAEQGRCIEGSLPIGKMLRLGESLLSRQGEANVCLSFARDADGLNVVEGVVHADLKMQCQRCLGPMKKSIDWRFRLVMVHNDAEAPQIRAEHELLEVADETIFVMDMIEDELVLSLPLIPKHDDPAACDAAVLDMFDTAHVAARDNNDEQRAVHNPFAVLRDLKKS